MKKSIILIGLLFVSLSLSACTDQPSADNDTAGTTNPGVTDTNENTDLTQNTDNTQSSDNTQGTNNTQNSDPSEQSDAVVYENTEYGFRFELPDPWKEYKVITEKWEGTPLEENQGGTEEGPKISLRHPDWTAEEPMQDIPILILTIDQWDALQAESFHIGAAPIEPKELGRNDNYVFALPARYNFAFPKGYEEVEDILSGNPLTPIK